MARILVDSSALFAFSTRNDTYHGEAVSYIRNSAGMADVLIVLDVVFEETMTLFKSRANAAVAIRIGQEVRQSSLYRWQAIGADGERDTWAIFQQYDDKDWSYVDCALLAMAQRLGVNHIFSFDEHIDQMPGITRVPRPARRTPRR
jgi:predicted nucleic acid-binding protein